MGKRAPLLQHSALDSNELSSIIVRQFKQFVSTCFYGIKFRHKDVNAGTLVFGRRQTIAYNSRNRLIVVGYMHKMITIIILCVVGMEKIICGVYHEIIA